MRCPLLPSDNWQSSFSLAAVGNMGSGMFRELSTSYNPAQCWYLLPADAYTMLMHGVKSDGCSLRVGIVGLGHLLSMV